jgi:hypothetical protein
MRYRIAWDTEAYRALERIWDAFEDPSPIARAVDAIHEMLSEDADQQGESRSRGRRVLIAPPLGIVIQAQARIGEVLVVRVWMIRSRRQGSDEA